MVKIEDIPDFEIDEEVKLCAKIPVREWVKKLKSNNGIFKRYKGKVSHMGPTIQYEKNGKIIVQGAQSATEIISFGLHIGKKRYSFFSKLMDISKTRAMEYLLVTGRGFEIWEIKIDSIKKAIEIFERELKFLKGEEKSINKRLYKEIKELHKIFPEIEEELVLHIKEVDAGIEHDVRRIKKIIKMLINGLEQIYNQYPLFKDYKFR